LIPSWEESIYRTNNLNTYYPVTPIFVGLVDTVRIIVIYSENGMVSGFRDLRFLGFLGW
jgi:hypothetical protein